tara:strand:+ start:14911 stop:17244 length:2334 start_codon:yes stop_codon:yes gene_type:complete
MPTALQLRRGTTSQNNSFTGSVGEVSVDTTLDTLRVHDGSTAGGFEVTTNTATQTLTNKTLTSPTVSGLTLSDSSIVFEGATADSFETTVTAADATADRTVTIPDATTTLVGTDTTQTLTNKTLTTPTIAEIDSGSTITLDATTDIVLDADGANITMKDGGTTVLDFVLNGSTDVTLDAPGDIILDADGGDVTLKDAGTTFGSLTNTSGNLIIKSGTTTALTMSGANVTVAGNLTVSGSTTTVDSTTVSIQNAFVFEGATDDSFETTLNTVDPTADRTISLPNATGTVVLKDTTDTLTNKTLTTPTIAQINNASGAITLDASTDIILDADGADIILKDGGTTFGDLSNSSGELVIKSGSSSTTAATFAGANVTFAGTVGSGAITSTSTVQGTTITATSGLVSPNIVFEGSTADSFETTLSVIDPTADRAVNIANVAGTLQPFSAASTDAISATPAEINTTSDGGTSVGTTAVADDDGIVTNDGGTMRQTKVQTFATYFASEITNMSNLVESGALNAGSITSGFGNIDNGSSTLNTGAATVTSLTNTGNIVFEGSTADSFETTLAVTDPTADRTITFPDATGTVITSGNLTAITNVGTLTGNIVFEGSTDDSFETTLAPGNPTSDITLTMPTQAGTIVVSNTTDGNDVQLDSLGLNTAASGTAGELRATNDITAFYSSDVALKENIINIPSPLEMIKKINGVFFDWKDSFIKSKGGEDGYFVRKRDVGVIAQDVEKVMPEVVATRKDGIKAVKYDRLVSVLIEAVKELTDEVNELKKR